MPGSLEMLAQELECSPAEIPALLASLNADPITRRWRSILERYYLAGQSLTVIGRELGVTPWRASELRAKTIERLRRARGLPGPMPRGVAMLLALHNGKRLEDVALDLTCGDLGKSPLATPRTMLALYQQLKLRKLLLKCGCPILQHDGRGRRG